MATTSACRGLVSAGRRCRTHAPVIWPLVRRGLDARCDSNKASVYFDVLDDLARQAQFLLLLQLHRSIARNVLMRRTCGVGCSIRLLRHWRIYRPLVHHQIAVGTVCLSERPCSCARNAAQTTLFCNFPLFLPPYETQACLYSR